MKTICSLLCILPLLTLSVYAQHQPLPLVPAPVSVAAFGTSSRLPETLGIYVGDASLGRTAELLVESLGLIHHQRAAIVQDTVVAHLHLSLASRNDGRTEWYRLEASERGVRLSGDPSGVFYGTQTLLQLISGNDISGNDELRLSHAVIEDHPRFAWRGMHLDVARHFRSVDFVKRYIDLMARFKLNTFHWHLTDDQGWRIEISAYPKLTEIGAWRKETIVAKNSSPYQGDGIPHGGFYTQEEVREVVAYAAERHITVVPEIEMPGHALAALAAYPELACSPGPFEVAMTWGVFEDVFCPTETTFRFLEEVLDEVIQLFPSTYIHVGGDEVPKRRWRESVEAQEVIKREGLQDEVELQSWFIQRIGRYLNAKGRLLLGWDEILEGGLAPKAAVMSWRGEAGGLEAARQGHPVVMTPSFALYFDYYQADPSAEPLAIGGHTPLEKVYAYDPIPTALEPSFHHRVMGAQANLWSEYIKTDAQVDYMVFPRLMVLAERVWSPKDRRDLDAFRLRLRPQYRMLDQLEVHYRIPEPIGFAPVHTLADEAQVELEPANMGGCLQYTLDGTDPMEDAYCHATVSLSIPLMEGAQAAIKLVAVTSTGRRSNVRELPVGNLQMIPGLPRTAQLPGLDHALYPANVNRCSALDPSSDHQTGTMNAPGPPQGIAAPYVQLFTGYLEIPFDGIYSLNLTSDDGSLFWLDGLLEIDNDGRHSAVTKTAYLALEHGLHPIKLCHFDAGGGQTLTFEVKNSHGKPVQIKYWR